MTKAGITDHSRQMPVVRSLAELCALLEEEPGLYVRVSEGPAVDREGNSTDYEAGVDMPGLSANPLDVEPWWPKAPDQWVARKLCNYVHLAEKRPERFAWVLRGREVGRGTDLEPLLADVEPVARLDDALLEEAKELYEREFRVAHDGT